jgi:hypothetical protein
MQIVFRADGSALCLYGEAIDLRQLGALAISRASHVEPDANGQWLADLSPVGGPKLGPFATRSQALVAEEAWLLAHHLLRRA